MSILISLLVGLIDINSKVSNNNNNNNNNNDPWYDPHNPIHRELKSSSDDQPNFVFILADDLGYNALGYDDSDIDFATPFLTNMANEGIILTNYYSPEVCTPAIYI